MSHVSDVFVAVHVVVRVSSVESRGFHEMASTLSRSASRRERNSRRGLRSVIPESSLLALLPPENPGMSEDPQILEDYYVVRVSCLPACLPD